MTHLGVGKQLLPSARIPVGLHVCRNRCEFIDALKRQTFNTDFELESTFELNVP